MKINQFKTLLTLATILILSSACKDGSITLRFEENRTYECLIDENTTLKISLDTNGVFNSIYRHDKSHFDFSGLYQIKGKLIQTKYDGGYNTSRMKSELYSNFEIEGNNVIPTNALLKKTFNVLELNSLSK